MIFERFTRVTHALLVQFIGDCTVMILGNQLRNGAAEIPQKAICIGCALDDDAGERRQPRMRIVAAPLLELFENFVGPVLRAGFDAVCEQRRDSCAAHHVGPTVSEYIFK